MKAVALTGGLGTGISKDSQLTPKPMMALAACLFIWKIIL